MDAEAVGAAKRAVGEDAAAGGRQRRGAGRASTDYCNRRRAEGDGRRRLRADVLRIGAPEKRLIAELDVEVARSSHEIDARRAEGGRDVGLCEIKQAGARVGRIGNGNVETDV